MAASSKATNAIAYFINANIQHLPPVIQLYPLLKGTLITTNQQVADLVKTKYAHLDIELVHVKSVKAARKAARKLKIRVAIHTGFKLLNSGRAVQIFHGGLSDKRYLESARLICFDQVLFPGQKSHDKVELATTLPWIKEWHLVGYPKFDPVIKGDVQAKELFDNDRKTILYAPTWISQLSSIRLGERSAFGESSLHIWSLPIIEELAPEYNLILKFHSHMLKEKTSIYQQISDLIEEKNFSDSVKTVIDDNIVPYMAARYCDRLCLLHEGRQVETGSVNQVLNKETLAPVFGVKVFVDLENEPPVVLAQ